MKVWYKNSDPTKVISFGKSSGEADESSFEYAGEPAHGLDHAFYYITGGNTLVSKSKAEIDQNRANSQTADQQAQTKLETRLAAARGHAANGIPSTQSELKAAVNLLYKILNDKGILGG